MPSSDSEREANMRKVVLPYPTLIRNITHVDTFHVTDLFIKLQQWNLGRISIEANL